MTTIGARAGGPRDIPRAVARSRAVARAVLAPRPSRARAPSRSWAAAASPRPGRLADRLGDPRRVAKVEREPDDDDDDDVSAESPSASSEAAEEPPDEARLRRGWARSSSGWRSWRRAPEYDPEIKNLLDGADSNPDEVEKRIRERFEQRKERIYKEREGSTVPMLVKFRRVQVAKPLDPPRVTQPRSRSMEQPLLDEVFKAWFVLGKLGGFNSDNMQVQANFFEVSNMEYDMEQANGGERRTHVRVPRHGRTEYKGGGGADAGSTWERGRDVRGRADQLADHLQQGISG